MCYLGRNLGESQEIAVRRLRALNRKLDEQPSLKLQYTTFMDEYLKLGHMTEVTELPSPETPHYFIPHRAVAKESNSTSKFRVVFDASCKTSSGKSLNDILRVGPTIRQDLFHIVTRFRQHRFVLSADIEKMYRQVRIKQDQRRFQLIVWRADTDQPIKTYQLNTVTYGTAIAPFLAIRSLHQLAYECANEHPIASQIILHDFYVDDLLTGGDDSFQLQAIKEDLEQVLRSAGFPLRKWTSNLPDLMGTSPEYMNIDNFIGDEVRTLGLVWNPNRDSFHYRVSTFSGMSRCTKRSILSTISQIYDPLGLIGPVCIKAKIILQELWKLKLTWDKSLPSDFHKIWKQYYDQLTYINDVSIPRRAICSNPLRVELHGFCDASETAYGACIYIRSITTDDRVTVRLLCAKSRVAPLKTITIPRLELCGAVLLARLTQRISESWTRPIDAKYYWSNSQIVLSWIAGEASEWKIFVANRISEIHDLTEKDNWNHVRSADNPADIISRGSTPKDLLTSNLWWNGPSWLAESTEEYGGESTQVIDQDISQAITLEAKPPVSVLTTTIIDFDLLSRFSSLRTLRRVVAYCIRFMHNALHPTQRRSGLLSVEELRQANVTILKISQAEFFTPELNNLRKKTPVSSTSKLQSLFPFVDADGLIRVGGRLRHSDLPETQKFPVVLASNSAFTKLLIQDTHVKHLHAGLQALLSILYGQYWILSARSTARKVLHRCITCYRLRPKHLQQIMGDLPSVRVQPSRAFLNVGVDYGGPFNIKISRNKTNKAYLCLFVCLATRAIHLELVSDLSTSAFLNALKRFIARRGKCINIYSDNGSNFKGANNELKELANLLLTDAHQRCILEYSADNFVKWHFIPPHAPHMGGIWEAGIKSAKTHLKRILGNALLTFEEFYTLTTEIEACLNSRPMSPMSHDPSDLSALSPGHFLIGAPLTSIPEPDLSELASNRLTRYQLLAKLQQHFWKRWSREYLTQFQARTKWKEERANKALQVGT
ncbi:PREDICTED: uncharacterized protein LOC105556299, partial [Vollenhovia emeryi]|uniref:uncharacterized protein LOC105556299 n=1 Tax=Vollenhovia emeryi TaxID=411798 RepID=UPI0005F37A7A